MDTKKLKEVLKDQGFTQEVIAKRLGISQAAVSKLLKTGNFGKKTAARWEDAFGISAIWLLTGEGNMMVGDNNQQTIIKAHTYTPAPQAASRNELEQMLSVQRELNEMLKRKDELLQAKDEQINRLISLLEKNK